MFVLINPKVLFDLAIILSMRDSRVGHLALETTITLSAPNFSPHLSPALSLFFTNYGLKRSLYVKLKD